MDSRETSKGMFRAALLVRSQSMWTGKNPVSINRTMSKQSMVEQNIIQQWRWIKPSYAKLWGFPGGSVGKESFCNAGDTGDKGLIPGLGRSPGGGHGNPPVFLPGKSHGQRGAWQAMVQRVTKSQTWLRMHAHKDTKTPVSSRFASLFYALYFCHAPGVGTSLVARQALEENRTERVDVSSPGKSHRVCSLKQGTCSAGL